MLSSIVHCVASKMASADVPFPWLQSPTLFWTVPTDCWPLPSLCVSVPDAPPAAWCPSVLERVAPRRLRLSRAQRHPRAKASQSTRAPVGARAVPAVLMPRAGHGGAHPAGQREASQEWRMPALVWREGLRAPVSLSICLLTVSASRTFLSPLTILAPTNSLFLLTLPVKSAPLL